MPDTLRNIPAAPIPLHKGRLGRGLASLIGEPQSQAGEVRLPEQGEQRLMPIADLHPSGLNPRKDFADTELAELADSIRAKGLVQPIICRPDKQRGGFEIVAGERRWRAAQRAGVHTVPAIVRDLSDLETLEFALIENVQRADLNPIEEATGYQQLIDAFGYSQNDIAGSIGKSRSHIANTLRLLKLPEGVRAYLKDGRLTAGHARALIGAADPEAMAKQIVEAGMTVRDAEVLGDQGKAKPKRRSSATKDPDTVALEKALSDATGLSVTINHKKGGTGEIKIRYLSLEQLDDVCRRLKS
jgi:ParB family chromosome partitioning protein